GPGSEVARDHCTNEKQQARNPLVERARARVIPFVMGLGNFLPEYAEDGSCSDQRYGGELRADCVVRLLNTPSVALQQPAISEFIGKAGRSVRNQGQAIANILAKHGLAWLVQDLVRLGVRKCLARYDTRGQVLQCDCRKDRV